MTLSEPQIQNYIKNPHLMLHAAMDTSLSEDDWAEIYKWLLCHRMTDELHTYWFKNQLNNGKWKYRALGQIFARFATIGKGFSTVDNATKNKLDKMERKNNEKMSDSD